jgi:site-specific DNA-methyltransferase (adenine-specific)
VKPAIEVGGARVFPGDCREVLKALPDNSVDSIVTDPPYELGFMGKKWDSSGIAYDVTVWQECLRVLKPGGHILAFGGSRTWHRLAVAVEDAGFEIRDNIAWIYGSGFPKSLNIAKNIDKAMGVESEVVGTRMAQGSARKIKGTNAAANKIPNSGSLEYDETVIEITKPSSSEAQQWEGWGTALKPAHEPIVVGRKPLTGTVAENVLAWGVGGLNIDASRVKFDEGEVDFSKQQKQGATNPLRIGGAKPGDVVQMWKPEGRWPANVIFDEVTAGLLDEQSGVSVSRAGVNPEFGRKGGIMGVKTLRHDAGTPTGHNDSGGASRFFYVAKASKRDRNEGLEGLDVKPLAYSNQAKAELKRGNADFDGGDAKGHGNKIRQVQNFHPTVKPTALMRYLIKLVTPPGGTVLDPFTGSGSTGKAALLDGFQFVGIELTEEYLPIIEGRLRWATEQVDDDDTLF